MKPSPEIIIGLFFIVIGLFSLIYKPYYDADKSINLKKISIYTGLASIGMGALFLILKLVLSILQPSGFYWFPSGIIIIVLAFLVAAFRIRKWAMIKNPGEFNENSREGYYRRTQVAKRIAVVFAVLLTAFIVIGGVTMPKIGIKKESFVVKGYFGFTQKLDDIAKIDTLRSIPRVMWMNGGSGFFGIYKGNFNLLGMGNGKLFLRKEKPPYIYLKFNDDDFVIFNLKRPDDTRKFYNELKKETMN